MPPLPTPDAPSPDQRPGSADALPAALVGPVAARIEGPVAGDATAGTAGRERPAVNPLPRRGVAPSADGHLAGEPLDQSGGTGAMVAVGGQPSAPSRIEPAHAVPMAGDAGRTTWSTDPWIGSAAIAESFFSRYAGSTLKTYRAHIERYARWLGIPLHALPRRLIDGGAAQAHLDVERYRAHLRDERGCAPSTINGALAALRSLVRFLRRSHLCAWALDVSAERSRRYRDTRGPGLPAVQQLLRAAERQADRRKAARDVAIVRLLLDRALRRGELVALDVAHVERDAAGAPVALLVRGKGQRERERLSLPPKTRIALAAWLAARGPDAGPLFIALDPGAGRSGRGGRERPLAGRLTGEGVARILAALARRGGLPAPVRPHGIRHTAITAVLDAGADLRAAQRFSRHADPRTLIRYDDNRTDIGGELATRLSEQL